MKYRLWMMCLCVIGMFCVSGCGRTSVKVTEAVRTDVPFVFETKVAAEPLHVFPVVPMVSGKVVSDMSDVGQVVAAGDVLFRVDSSAYEAQKAALEGQMTDATVSVPNVAPPDGPEGDLLKEGIITRAEYDRIRMRKGVGSSPSLSSGSGVSRQAGVTQALAALQRSIEDCVVKAPVSGVVSRVYRGDAKVVMAGKPALVIQQNSPVIFVFNMPSVNDKFLEKAKVEKALTVMISDGTHEWYGELKRRGLSDVDGYTAYKVQMDNVFDDVVMGDMYHIHIESEEVAPAMIFPRSVLLDEHTVEVVTDEGLIDWRTVEVVADKDGQIRIISGIHEGDKVVTHADPKLEIGMAVSIK